MMGLGTTIQYTPTNTGIVKVWIRCTYTTATAAAGVTITPKYGLVSGGVPANAAAFSGTSWGSAGAVVPPSIGGNGVWVEFQRLTLTNAAYWFDLDVATASALDTASITGVECLIEECR